MAILRGVTPTGCGSSGEDTPPATTEPSDSGTASGHDADDGTSASTDAGVDSDADAASDASADAAGVRGDIVLGEPIVTPDGAWTTVPFPEAYCRDGSQAHLDVRLNSGSKKFAIFLEGGGECSNDELCKAFINLPSHWLNAGIWDFKRTDNPIRDFNVFFVPYCEGDFHGGDNDAGTPGPKTGTTKFTGYTNMKLYLSRILASVPGATDELLFGVSAGGFGATLTTDLVARNMPATVQRFTLLNDSGLPFSNLALAPCWQDWYRTLWGFDATFLNDCGPACPNHGDYVADWMKFLIGKYAKGPDASKFMAGVITSNDDHTLENAAGYGADNCTAHVPLTASQFQAALTDVRNTTTAQTDRFGTFYYPTTNGQHGALVFGLDTKAADGTKLLDWMNALLAHTKAGAVGP